MTETTPKLTKPQITSARRRILKELVYKGGSATPYDLAYPRASMMHALLIGGLVEAVGETNSWQEPAGDGVWRITDAGREALERIAK